MKRVEIVASNEVEVQPFLPDDFIKEKSVYCTQQKVTKKELKQVAKRAGLNCNEAEITVAKKLLNAYLAGK